nr:MAG TPA: Repressor protein CI [Caudoviricetes sp.]
MSFGNILKKIRQENNLTQEELAKKIDTSRSNIANYENDKNMPSIDILDKLSKIFNCSIDYLLGKTNKNAINISDKIYMCPVYGQIPAGEPNWAEECIEGRLPLDPNLMNIVDPEECYFLRVNGESMNKVIKNGAYALIRKTDWVENGEIAVVLVNGYDATLKKFTKNNDVVVLEPVSNDPTFQTQIYTKDTPIKIIGKYIGKMEMQN